MVPEPPSRYPLPISFDIGSPNPYIYVLSQDGKSVCFSSHMKGIKKAMRSCMKRLNLKHIGKNLSENVNNVDPSRINICVEDSNFLFKYSRIVSEFKIEKIPHFRVV